jgi:hypothetical protein
MKRDQQVLLCSSACAVLAVGLLWLYISGGGQPERASLPQLPLSEHKEQGASEQAAQELPSAERVHQESIARGDVELIGAEAPAARIMTIEEGLTELRSCIEQVEVANSTILYQGNAPGFASTRLQIAQPGPDQMEEIQRVYAEVVQAMPLGSPAVKEVQRRGSALIDDYCSYPRPVKVIQLNTRSDGTVAEFFEWYAESREMFLPNPNGSLPIPLPPQAVLRTDSDYGGPKSWAAKRYPHFFTVEERSAK